MNVKQLIGLYFNLKINLNTLVQRKRKKKRKKKKISKKQITSLVGEISKRKKEKQNEKAKENETKEQKQEKKTKQEQKIREKEKEQRKETTSFSFFPYLFSAGNSMACFVWRALQLMIDMSRNYWMTFRQYWEINYFSVQLGFPHRKYFRDLILVFSGKKRSQGKKEKKRNEKKRKKRTLFSLCRTKKNK